jgi:CO dehydrogenase/acetyl-CoA synthase epsilon subunit
MKLKMHQVKTKLAKSYIRKAKTPVDVVVGYKMFDNDVKVTSTKEGVNVKIKN